MTALLLSCALGACAHDEFSTGVWVRNLTIEGNRTFSDGDIRDKLATQKTGWWPFASKKWFDQAAFDLDLRRITAFYADHGYFDARVVSHEVKPAGSKEHAVDIVIDVQENSPTKIEDVAFRGFPAEGEKDARKVARSYDLQPGRPFTYADYSTARDRVGDRLREQGYAYARVDGAVRVDRDKHVATIELVSQPGPQVRFGRVTVDGNGHVPAWKLLNRVTWRSGSLYDPSDLATTQGRLYDLGVFSSVRLDLPPEPTEVADVEIHVHPGKLHEVRVGGGFGAEREREEVRAHFEWTADNFLGGLRKLRLRLIPAFVVLPSITDVQRSGPAAESDAQLTQPDIFGSRTTLNAVVGYDLGVADGYQYYGPRTQLGVDRPFFRDRLLAGGSYNLQYLNFFNVAEDVFGAAGNKFYGFTNPYRLAYLEEFAQVDLRNRPLAPTFGGYLALRAEEGSPDLGGQFRYLKLTPEIRVYVPLGRRVVLAGRGILGWIGTSEGEQSPITRRYAMGGPSSHRGFSVGRLAPQVLDVQNNRLIPVGGDGEVLFSADLRIEATKIGGAWLDVVPFVDAGDVTQTFSALNLRNLHIASGLSLEYTTPIGVVRVGAGVRLNRLGGNNPDPNDRYAIHIGIGEAF